MENEVWQLQEAKSRFSELVELAISKGPQIVSKRGVKAVVILSWEEFENLKKPKSELSSFFRSAPKTDFNFKRTK